MTIGKYIQPERSKRRFGLWVSICLFVVLDCTVLGINYYITTQLERDAQVINIAGRQRMLSQQMTKSLLMLQGHPDSANEHLVELKRVFSLFTMTLDALRDGGRVIGGSGAWLELPAVEDLQTQQLIRDASQQLAPLVPPVKTLLHDNYTQSDVEQAVLAVKETNLILLKQMNDLTSRVEQLSRHKTHKLRGVQTLAFFLAIANFLVIIFLYQRRSKLAESQVDSFLHLVDHTATALIVMSADRRVILANQTSQELFGYDAKTFIRLNPEELFREAAGEQFAVRRNGSSFRVEVSERSFNIHEHVFIILTINDISPYTDAQAELAYLANHDPLTGLVNRRALYDRLELEILHARRSGNLIGVYFLDLNGFKPVNDLHGHAVGDALLKLLAQRLMATMRETDTVARYGGDEFVILLTDVKQRSQIARCTEKLQQVFAIPFSHAGIELRLGSSKGLAVYPEDGETAGELIDIADQCMYADKQHNKTAQVAADTSAPSSLLVDLPGS